ncbi:Uncharacterised protein [Mycobacteroides abscessus subsp. abscessus]|nr:Uncharacterised protein [Mycobacteroides abscessus subsp. abscessus]
MSAQQLQPCRLEAQCNGTNLFGSGPAVEKTLTRRGVQ